MQPMTIGRAFAVCKSINSPSPFADVDDEVYIGKLEALEEKIRKARENAG